MRFELTIESRNNIAYIPINYNYYVMSSIYYILNNSSSEYSEFLHEQGYDTKRHFKLFNFSQIKTNRYAIEKGYLKLKGKAKIIVSSPVREFISHLIRGLTETTFIKIAEEEFIISGIELIPQVEFSEIMRYKCLSPFTISRLRENKSIYYLRSSDKSELEMRLAKNIINKSASLHIDNKNISFKLNERMKEKLITIKENRRDETKIKALYSDMTIKANTELQKFCYDVGVGERNSMGFGMLRLM